MTIHISVTTEGGTSPVSSTDLYAYGQTVTPAGIPSAEAFGAPTIIQLRVGGCSVRDDCVNQAHVAHATIAAAHALAAVAGGH